MFACTTTCRFFHIVREVDFSHEVIVFSTDSLTEARRMLAMLSRFNVSGCYRIV
jgi:hypothetical protein